MLKKIIVAIFALSLLAGCASKEQRDGTGRENGFSYAQKAIRVNVTAAKDLNTFNNQPHTLVLVLYQLDSPDVFDQMVEAPNGIAQLLQADAFDKSVLARSREVIQPGEQRVLYLDRAEGARYIAVVAGYYNRRSQDVSRLMPIVLRKRSAFFWHGSDQEPADTIIELDLGGDRIETAEPA